LGITSAQWSYVEALHDPSGQLTVHLYLVTLWRGMPTNRQLEEQNLVHWFTLAEAMQLSLADPSYPALFERYMD